MFNLIRSDFYRMVRLKSFIIILAIIAFMNVASLLASKMMQQDEAYQEYLQKVMEEEKAKKEDDPGAQDVGMSILVKADDDGKYELVEVCKSFLSGYMALLFIGIFTVIFVTADFNNGYIKNYGGQLRFRTRLMCSKSICLVVYTAILFAVTVLSTCVGIWLGGEVIKVTSVGTLFHYLSIQFLLHVVFAVVITAACVIVRNNLVTMALCCCISMNIINILYRLGDKGLEKLGWKNADITRYTVSGRIAQYATDGKMLCSTIIIALAFFAVAMLAGGTWLHKKDLV